MRIGVRGKLVASALGLTVLVAVASGLYLEPRLADFLEGRLRRSIVRDAQAAAAAFELAPALTTGADAQAFVTRTAAASGARVSIIVEDGTLVADSEVAPADLGRVENHRNRPEVRQALETGVGSAGRTSATVEKPMIYAAARFDAGGRRGVVRFALPLTEVRGDLRQMRLVLLVGAVVGLLAALVASAIAGHRVRGMLQEVAGHARRLAVGRREPGEVDGLGAIAGSVDRIAEELEATVSTLARERERVGTILEGMSEAVLALDGAGRVTLANAAALELLGLARPPLGHTLLETVRAPELERLVAGGTQAIEAELELPGPPPRRVLARARPLGGAGGMVLVMHDVTELRRLETVRRDFVANVSHELRTPVSVIRANAETLLDGALDDRARAGRFVEAIGRNADRLAALLADLLDISRLESGAQQLSPVALPVEPALRSAVETFEGRARAREVRLAVGAVQPGLVVLADPSALEQVLSNYVDNAIKYGPKGGTVRLDAAREPGGAVLFSVTDDGPGIEPRHRARIFERFYRIDPGRSREMGGTGLGLAIVKHLAEAMGGTVGVGPASPQGSVFWVRLPAAKSGSAAPPLAGGSVVG